jgi:vacuolar-type H+-ATPase subunit F/Vma7
MKVAVLGDRHSVLGFQLAGIEGKEPGPHPMKVLDDFMERDDLGILIVTSEIAQTLKHEIATWKRRKHFPIIVEIQEFGKELTEDRIGDLLKRAVGMDIST